MAATILEYHTRLLKVPCLLEHISIVVHRANCKNKSGQYDSSSFSGYSICTNPSTPQDRYACIIKTYEKERCSVQVHIVETLAISQLQRLPFPTQKRQCIVPTPSYQPAANWLFLRNASPYHQRMQGAGRPIAIPAKASTELPQPYPRA